MESFLHLQKRFFSILYPNFGLFSGEKVHHLNLLAENKNDKRRPEKRHVVPSIALPSNFVFFFCYPIVVSLKYKFKTVFFSLKFR